MDALHPEELAVPVAGGTLRVCRWPGTGPVVLAAHGITGNALSWAEVARALAGRAVLVAADLRGRAGSRHLPGPYGMTAHAADLVAVLDHLDVAGPAVVAGHSMGGFVAAVTGVRYPDRVAAVLLVDGGVQLPAAPEADIDEVLAAVIGPAMQRLSMTFPSREAYVDFFRAHPAYSGGLHPTVEAYVLRDLVGEAPELRSSCVREAVREDGADILGNPDTIGAVAKLTQPVRMLWAPRGLLDEPQGLYDEGRLAAASLPERIVLRRVDGVNHYTILVDPAGAEPVAEQIAELVTAV